MTLPEFYSEEEEIHRTGIVVERFSEIEKLINTIIFDYVSPTTDAEDFVKINLLDNSVVSFGSKVKLLQVINRNLRVKLVNPDKYQRLLSLRNAFAHNNINQNLEIESNETKMADIYFFIESMKGDGTMRRLRRTDAFKEFISLFKELKPLLNELSNTIWLPYRVR
jgi:hypothetical protein